MSAELEAESSEKKTTTTTTKTKAMKYRLCVVGSSRLTDPKPVCDYLDNFICMNGKPSVVITGDRRTGVESIVRKWASINGIQCTVYAPQVDSETNRLSPGAYSTRTKDMLNASNVIIAMPMHRRSKHTWEFINTARTHTPALRCIKINTIV